MKTDYIDIVFLHNMHNRGGWEKGVLSLEEIRKMIGEGKVRFAGVADHSNKNLFQIDIYADLVDVILLRYSCKRKDEAEAALAKAKSLDIGTFAMKVFGGAYDSWDSKAPNLSNHPHLQPLLDQGISLSHAVVRFVLNNPNLSSALIGMRKNIEIKDNAAALYNKKTVLS